MGLKNYSYRAFVRRYFFLIPVILLSCTATLQAQITEYESSFISFASKDQEEQWSEWTDWAQNSTYFEIDLDEEFITVYDVLDENIYLIMSSEELEDEEGDLQTVYECVDEDFYGVTITLIERISLEDERTEIYVETDSESTAYIVEPVMK